MEEGLEVVNRICPICKSGNYMAAFRKPVMSVFKYKCMNCNYYLREEDFEKAEYVGKHEKEEE